MYTMFLAVIFPTLLWSVSAQTAGLGPIEFFSSNQWGPPAHHVLCLRSTRGHFFRDDLSVVLVGALA